MKTLIALTGLLALAPVVVPDAAADEFQDLDNMDGKKKAKKQKKTRTLVAEDEVVREVERGWYVKGNVGVTFYLLRYAGIVSPGTGLQLSVGDDFVDNENSSMAWEVGIYEGVHNAMPFTSQSNNNIPENRRIQGDTRTIAFTAAYEYSAYPGRRIGIGFRIGGGVLLTPLLMNKDYYLSEIIGSKWAGEVSGPLAVHELPHVIAFGGPTLEYYTKLSHFSVGIDADVSYSFGFDLGVTATGFLKYTF